MGLGAHGLARRLSIAVGKQNYYASSLDCVGCLCEIARVVFLLAIVILMGWFNYTRNTSIISPYDFRRTIPEKGAIAVVRGGVATPPKTQRVGTRERVQLSVDVSSIRLDETWEVGYGRVVVITTNKLGLAYNVGKQIQVDGVLIPPESASSPGLYDNRQQLVRLGIYHELRADTLSKWEVYPALPVLSWSERFQTWGRSVLGRGFPDNDPAIELLRAMSLGWRTGLTGKTAEPFMRSGTMHLFAISGLHVALVAGILMALLGITRLNRQWAGVVAIPLLWFYAGATGWQPSAVRATTMITLVLSAWVFKRPVNVLNSLGMAAFLILMWNPQQLFRASFQLSFAVVFSLAVVVPPVAEWFHSQVRPDAYLPQQLWPRWRRWALWPSYWLAGALAVSFGAWLASLPLVAHHFNLFSPIALLANVPVVICGMAALASCLGSLFFGAWMEPVSVLFNHAGWFYMNAMMVISRWAADLPGAWQYVRSPSHWMIIGWYLLLFAIGSGWLLKAKMRRWLFCGMIVYVCALIWSWKVDRDAVRMTFLPDGPVIHMEGKEGMLIDCGDEGMVEHVIPRHLRSRGVGNIGNLVITHSVKHHAGGFVGLLEEQLITRVSLSHTRSTSKVHKMVLENLGDSNRKRIVSAGDKIGPW
ncbi:MAG: ComEC/Rec2 family competence protein, partial [Verrucomicrobiota bacterium]|nr:ComEC/Rec2 family competence protein [Verrucomicrobiota bacterium]